MSRILREWISSNARIATDRTVHQDANTNIHAREISRAFVIIHTMRKSIIRKSPYFLVLHRGVSGLGVFTNNYIKRGAFVIEYGGELITNKEADRRGGKYLFKINKDWVIDGTSRKNTARYINHSCRPNCEDKIEKKRKRIFIYSKRNIKPGTELTLDYGKEYFNEYIKPKGCGCEKCLEKKNTARRRITPSARSVKKKRRKGY